MGLLTKSNLHRMEVLGLPDRNYINQASPLLKNCPWPDCGPQLARILPPNFRSRLALIH